MATVPSERFTRLIDTSFSPTDFEALKGLTAEERVLVYYLYRAAVSGYRVALFQLCRYPEVLDRIRAKLDALPAGTDAALADQLQAWWVFLFANLGVHCIRESVNNKKTPALLGLDLLTRDRLAQVGLEFSDAEWQWLADPAFQHTATVPGSIDQSGNAFYPPGYTDEDYKKVPTAERDCLVGYHTKGGMRTYSSSDVCAAELTRVCVWLKKAHAWAAGHPATIPADVTECLVPLIRHLESGKEDDFKDHSRLWLKLKNRVEFCLGFIEYYDDPMHHVGTFQADVTVKAADISPLVALLPSFEERFPFPPEYKRKDMSSLPNAAPVHKIVGMGGLGPVFCTLAYCLPNYQDIRSELGSKQVMYPAPRPSDPKRHMAIFCDAEERRLYETHSPDLELEEAIACLCTTLHETIGHASGSMIEGVTEKVRNERLGRWGNGLEEMRAEILALYSFTRFYDEIVQSGFLGRWPSVLTPSEAKFLAVQHIAGGGWRRWRGLPSGTTAITQAHALADTGIMYYLIDNTDGAVTLSAESVDLPEKDGTTTQLPVLRFRIGDLDKVLPAVEQLAQKVQHMSSTADVAEVNEFMEKYAASTRDPSYADIVTGMRDAARHGVIETVNVFPELDLVVGEAGAPVDATPRVPESAIAHFKRIFDMSLQ